MCWTGSDQDRLSGQAGPAGLLMEEKRMGSPGGYSVTHLCCFLSGEKGDCYSLSTISSGFLFFIIVVGLIIISQHKLTYTFNTQYCIFNFSRGKKLLNV